MVILQVSVDWEATSITAQTSRLYPTEWHSRISRDDVSSIQLPLSIINDAIPEFAETLSVSLVGSGGDARLDGILTATITILANDDPNGALRKHTV